MVTNRSLAIIVATAALALQASGPPGRLPSRCERGPAKASREGSTWVIPADSRPRCSVAFIETGVALRSADGAAQNILPQVVRGGDGRFYTFDGRGHVHIWNSDGSIRKTVGRLGGGPGELAGGAVSIHPVSSGFFVRDNAGVWSVFDSAGRFVRSRNAFEVGHSPNSTAMISDGVILDAQRPLAARDFFAVEDVGSLRNQGDSGRRGATMLRSFGAVTQPEQLFSRTNRERRISMPTVDAFWAGPPKATGRGYQLELWSSQGKLLRVIQRDAPWFPRGADTEEQRSAIPPVPPTEVAQVHADTSGLLIVAVRTSNRKSWDAVIRAGAREDTAMLGRVFDIYLEVFDTRAGELLASLGPVPILRAQREIAVGWFRGTTMGYQMHETPGGEIEVRILELSLAAK